MFEEASVIYRYKYLPFSEGALKTVSEGTIKFTCPLEFNDPFDCRPFYNTEEISQVPKNRRDLFKAAGDRRGLSPAARLKQKGKFLARLQKRVDDGSFAKSLISDIGVVSLSRNPLNILMWSHYADYHRGFVLEFRIPTRGTKKDSALTLDRLLPFPVKYKRKRPHIAIGMEQPDPLVNKLLLTKSKDWSYEEEERVIDHERGPGIFRYRRDEILSSVIAGIDMNEDQFKDLDALVRNAASTSQLQLNIYRAEEKKDEFKLIVPNHPRLDSNAS